MKVLKMNELGNMSLQGPLNNIFFPTAAIISMTDNYNPVKSYRSLQTKYWYRGASVSISTITIRYLKQKLQ